MAKVGNVNIRKQGMCVGARGRELKIIFRRQLSDAGDIVKKFLFYLSCPRPCVLSVPVAWSVAGLEVKNGGCFKAELESAFPAPLPKSLPMLRM